MDRLGIDIMGPLPISNRRNKYLLVIRDYFSGWMEAYAIPDQKAETIAQLLCSISIFLSNTEFLVEYLV